jgi:hypothetical protein
MYIYIRKLYKNLRHRIENEVFVVVGVGVKHFFCRHVITVAVKMKLTEYPVAVKTFPFCHKN